MGRRSIALAACLLAAPLLASEKGSETLKRSLADLKAGRYSQLDQDYEKGLRGGTRERVLSLLTFRLLGLPANIPDLEKWAQKKPKSPSAWGALGLAHLERAKTIRKTAPRSKEFKEAYEKAEACVDKAYELSPKDINLSSFQIECRQVGGWGRRAPGRSSLRPARSPTPRSR